MAETQHSADARASAESRKLEYKRPGIAWEEEYKPAAFGLSCAKLPAVTNCNPGPFLV